MLKRLFSSNSEPDSSPQPSPSSRGALDKVRAFCQSLPLADGPLPAAVRRYGGSLGSASKLLESFMAMNMETALGMVAEITLIGRGVERLRNEFSMEGTQWVDGDRLEVRVVLSEGCSLPSFRNPQSFLAPVLPDLPTPLDNPFPSFTTALIVGPFYLEWNHSSLVIPRRPYGQARTLLSESILVGHCSTADLPHIAAVLADFNSNRSYLTDSCNTQTFVDAVLASLTGPFPRTQPSSPLGALLEQVRCSGKAQAELVLSKGVSERLILPTKERLVFESHTELDLIAKALMEECRRIIKPSRAALSAGSTIKSSGRGSLLAALAEDDSDLPLRDELLVLRALDAGFWRRLNASMEEEFRARRRGEVREEVSGQEYTPGTACPFHTHDDPVRRMTGTQSV